MIWETVAALVLIFGTLPVWVLAALLWGCVRAAAMFFSLMISFLSAESPDWSQAWLVPVGAVLQGFASAWSVPSGVWTWAKFEHPWWAALIGLACFSLFGRSNGSR